MKQLALAFILLLAAAEGRPADGPRPAGDADPDRPRIGLALGGGGSRGAAHVGVLRVLEDQGIIVDYVAGTSMGAIVGALYALGLSADEIEQELLAVDWADLFDDRTSRQQRSMRRKEDDSASFFPLEFGLKNLHLKAPRGFIAGQKFPFAFRLPGLLTAGNSSFDTLPIPYRAVATDLETGDMVVLGDGSLIQAVRASMSIPGIFPPVERNGQLLVDGFLASNVPVRVVEEMGADIIIAVDVDRHVDAKSREELRTLSGITEQMARIRSYLSSRGEIERADIVIQPVVEEWSGQEFDELATIIPRGELAALEKLDELAPLGADPAEFLAWRRRVAEHPLPLPVVDLIVLDNRTRISDAVIWHMIDTPKGVPLDLDHLKDDLEKIYELGLVESVDFDLERVDGYTILNITVREKPYAPNIVHLGGAYSLSYNGASSFLFRGRVNRREVNRLGAEWRTDIALGAITGVESEFYQPLQSKRHWFARGYGLVQTRIDSYFQGNYTVGRYRFLTLGGGVSGGVNVANFLQLGGGISFRRFETKARSGSIPYPDETGTAMGPVVRLRFDHLDDPMIPRHGQLLQAIWSSPRRWLGTGLDYDRLWGNLTVARTTGRTTLMLLGQGGTSLGSDLPYYRQFYLGGMRALSGFRRAHLRGDAFAVGTVGVLYRLGGGRLPFSSRYYLGLWGGAGNAWEGTGDVSFESLLYSGAVSLILESPLGPLELGYGLAEGGEYAVHLEFGFHLSSPVN